MKKALTIEDLKNRVGKPVFVAGLIYGAKNWRVVKEFDGANTIEFTDKSAIAAEHQNKFRFFDGEVTALELKKILDAEEKLKKKTGYEAVKNKEIYYFLGINLQPTAVDFLKTSFFDAQNYKIANHFNDENLVKNIARAEILKNQLRRFAALNGGIPSPKDWQNQHCNKYYIYYDFDENKIYVCDTSVYKDFGQIYFKNKEACEKAIEIFKKELIWYFTEFEEMLY